ncbi:hypothetical protein [Nostoc sp. GT001]|uniref:hypothetical protein n=1 Tax=Nostoc sp. GT001 TaxID=3056647 RepID=UPI000DF9CF8C|nr:hypothetical protein [Nostoc sp. GT001]MBX9252986.1 hypothetical protein [Desmonostoc muscorum CCALA 125]MDM9580350.1 hypothetical protein [Nostoc sp. GT001]RCJ17421.1 hypothetical protein A6S26_31130 [Nostoc sp. ATCC 43529]
MPKKDVWVVFGHFLDLNYYYVSNTEWTFEIEEACLFKTKELAESTIGRLKTYEKKNLDFHGINPDSLSVERTWLEVSEFLHFTV